ncbi:MAG: hypothetical protein ACD_54C00458G0003 [uncultured bacterium]|nr:MAG: hypothetical protein ACD_54C00458G0003 [uncultured bacterium]
MRFWHTLISLALTLAAGIGLLVLSGEGRRLLAPALQAELVVQDFLVPPGFGLDPDRVAGFMADQLAQRLEDDVAIRLTLKSDVMKKVKTIVLPRLMNVVAVQSMMHDIPELSAILDIGSFRRTVRGTVHSTAAMQDVALTMPGALLAEVDGAKVKLTTTSTGLKALELGAMTVGQSHAVTLWLDDSALNADLGRSVKLGAAEGLRGRVLLWGDHDWFGADMEALRWSRWLIGAVLAGVLLFGLASLLLPFLRRT